MANRGPTYSHLGASRSQSESLITDVHRKSQDLPIVDRLIEPQTIAHFLEFGLGGSLPNGKQSSLVRLVKEETQLISRPDQDGTTVIDSVMNRIGSTEDSERMCTVGKNIQSLKSRLWDGVIPVSDQRWREKGLHQWANFDLATQHLSAVLAVFEYLNQPHVIQNLRNTFNLIWDHWEEFNVVLNEQRVSQGKEPVNVPALWTEFIAAHYEMMTARAHRWVLVRVNALRAPLLSALRSHEPAVEGIPDRVQWKLTDRLHILAEIVTVADFAILMPMHGYKGYTVPPSRPNVPAAIQMPDLAQRMKAHSQRLKQVTRMTMFRNSQSSRAGGGNSSHLGEPQSLHRTALDQIESQTQLRQETRGEPPETIPKEPWIVSHLRRIEVSTHIPIQSFGLVIYRLTYQQTDGEWASFVQKMEAHVADWGRGNTGSSGIKPYLKLHWLDGKALDIPEGDIEAAKKHFNDHASLSFDAEDVINDHVFLAVDGASFASYTTDSYSIATNLSLAGDFTGFVVAIDAEYDPREGCSRPEESPGYHGQMRILGSLVWGDLYALYSSQSAILEDLWPLALDHPNQVYIGPTIPIEVKSWRTQNNIRKACLRSMLNHIHAKLTGTAPRAEPSPEPLSTQNAPPTPVAPASLSSQDPTQRMIRSYLTGAFARHLRENNNTREAIMVEEMRATRPGEEPDMERLRRRMEAADRGEEEEEAPAAADPDPLGELEFCRPQ